MSTPAVVVVIREPTPAVIDLMQGLPGVVGAPWVLPTWPEAGEPLRGPRNLYSVTPGEPMLRELDAAAVAGDTVTVSVADVGINVTVKAPDGASIAGKPSIEVGSGPGAADDSNTFVFDGKGTWWLI